MKPIHHGIHNYHQQTISNLKNYQFWSDKLLGVAAVSQTFDLKCIFSWSSHNHVGLYPSKTFFLSISIKHYSFAVGLSFELINLWSKDTVSLSYWLINTFVILRPFQISAFFSRCAPNYGPQLLSSNQPRYLNNAIKCEMALHLFLFLSMVTRLIYSHMIWNKLQSAANRQTVCNISFLSILLWLFATCFDSFTTCACASLNG